MIDPAWSAASRFKLSDDHHPRPAGEGKGEGESFEREYHAVHGEGESFERERLAIQL
jgi:hypothetical protein